MLKSFNQTELSYKKTILFMNILIHPFLDKKLR